MQSALDLLRELRSAPPRPAGRLRVSEFAASGRLLRIRSGVLGGATVYLAADNADTSRVPPDAVIFYPDEFAQLRAEQLHPTAGPDFLKLLWETKRLFAPHARTHPEHDPA